MKEKKRKTKRIDPSGIKCPKCKRIDVRPSHPESRKDRFLSTLWHPPFRCNGCGNRFYHFAAPWDAILPH